MDLPPGRVASLADLDDERIIRVVEWLYSWQGEFAVMLPTDEDGQTIPVPINARIH